MDPPPAPTRAALTTGPLMIVVLAIGLALPVWQVVAGHSGTGSVMRTVAVDLVLVPLALSGVLVCAMNPGPRRRQSLALIWVVPAASLTLIVYVMLVLSILNERTRFLDLGF
ncbi:MAG: hypothetical protein P4L84_22835 [Isosphaeraceae bacterium]|nr:hypothetical protein [Isosphaeraceae bacterium]